jgi:hypothetical protein
MRPPADWVISPIITSLLDLDEKWKQWQGHGDEQVGGSKFDGYGGYGEDDNEPLKPSLRPVRLRKSISSRRRRKKTP